MKNIITIALVAAISISKAYAQIEYTDVYPDTTIFATTQQQMRAYDVDLDKDGSYDKEIRHFNPGGSIPASVELGNNGNPASVCQEIVLPNGHAKRMEMGDSIGPSQSWGYDQYGILDYPWYDGEKYLAVRLKKGTNWHYGWIRFSVPADGSSFTMMDYAYNKTPNVGLLAGQPIATGIVHTSRTGFKVEMDGKLMHITTPQPGLYRVQLSDMSGRTIKVCTIQDAGVLDAGTLPPALYVLTVTGAAGSYSCKVLYQ